jgi:photosystem II stability/assembly factor-like uncharacterized protein
MRVQWRWCSPVWVLMFLLVQGGQAQPKAWEPLGPEGGRVVSVAQDPTNLQVLLVTPYGYPSKVFKSTDRGMTWSLLTSISDYIQKLAFDPTSGNVVYACATSSMYRSTNAGQSWTRYALPYTTNSYYYAYTMVIDPVNTANMHLGCDVYDGANWVPGYLRSTDAGAHWAGQMFGSNQGAFQGVAVDAANPQYVYLGGYVYTGSNYLPKVYRSSNGGATFEDRSGSMGAGNLIYDMCADPVTGNKIYAVTVGGVYRTTDAGATWNPLTYVPSPYHMAVSKANPDLLFAASAAGYPYKSTNGGTSWTAMSSGIAGAGYNAILVESGPNPYVFFGNNSSIFRTTNGGTSWLSCCSGINCASITALRNAPSAQGTMYAAFLNNAVFKTTNASSATVSWQRIPDFYSCISVEDFAVAAANPDKLYAMEGGT